MHDRMTQAGGGPANPACRIRMASARWRGCAQLAGAAALLMASVPAATAPAAGEAGLQLFAVAADPLPLAKAVRGLPAVPNPAGRAALPPGSVPDNMPLNMPDGMPDDMPADMPANAAGALGDASLAELRGGTETPWSDMRLSGTVGGNSAVNVVTGANNITDGAFSNASGLPMVIQNSGANVLIQNATIVNVQIR